MFVLFPVVDVKVARRIELYVRSSLFESVLCRFFIIRSLSSDHDAWEIISKTLW